MHSLFTCQQLIPKTKYPSLLHPLDSMTKQEKKGQELLEVTS